MGNFYMPPNVSGVTPRPMVDMPRPAVMPGMMPQYDQPNQTSNTAPATMEDVGARLTAIEDQLRQMQSVRQQPMPVMPRPALQQNMPYSMNSLFGGIRGLF